MAGENAKGIIALNAVVSGAEQVRNLRTQLEGIIKTGGGKVKLEAETSVKGAEQTKQALTAIGRSYEMLNEKVAASLSFLERAVARSNSIIGAGRTPSLLGVKGIEVNRGVIKERLVGQASRLSGIPQKDILRLTSIYRQAELLSSVISATNRYDPSREQSALFERVDRSLKNYNRQAIRTGSPRIPLTLDPTATQEAASGALYTISQQLGALIPRRAIQYLPPGAAVAMANPNFLKGSLYRKIAGRIGGIEATQFNIPQQYIREAENYTASFGKYPDLPRIRVLPQISAPTSQRLIGPGAPRLSQTISPIVGAQAQLRAILAYNEFESLRTPEQYTAMIAPGLTGLNNRFTNLISSPLAMASLARRGVTGTSLRGAAGRKKLQRIIGEDMVGEGGQDPFLNYYSRDPYESGRSFSDAFSGGRNRQRPLADEAAMISQIYSKDPFQKASAQRQNLRFNQERYFSELKNRDIFQGAFGYNQFTPGGGLGGGGGGGGGAAGGGGKEGTGGGGIFDRFRKRFSGLLYFAPAAYIIYNTISAIEASIKKAVELEVVLKRIQGIYGGKTLGDQLTIRQSVVGTALKFSSDLLETARTAQLLAQEGLKPDKLRSNLEAIAQGSVGLGISQEGLANYVIALRNATGGTAHPIEGQEAVNLVASFVRKGAVSPQNIMTAIQQVLPVLETFAPSQANVSDPALIGSITSLIARRSSFTGSQVSNSLRFLIARFGSPETTAKIERISGVQLGTAESGGEQLRPFINIMTDLAEAFNKLEKAGQTGRASELIRTLFSTRQAGIGTIALRDWVQLLKDAKIAMDDYGSATELAAIQQDAWAKAWERITTRFVGGAQEGLGDLRSVFNFIYGTLYPSSKPGYSQGNITAGILTNRAVEQMFNGPTTPDTRSPGEILAGAFGPGISPFNRTKIGLPAPTGPEIPIDKTSPLFLDFSNQWDAYVLSAEKFDKGVTGQIDVIRDLGNSTVEPKKNLTELIQELDRFYTVAGDRIRAGQLGTLGPEILNRRATLRALIPGAQEAEVSRRRTEFDAELGLRINAENRRYNFQVGRTQLRLSRVYGKRGLAETIGGLLQQQQQDIGANRQFDINEQQLSFPEALRRLRATEEYKTDVAGDVGRADKERSLQKEFDYQILITNNKYTQLAIEADINAQYETRLKYLQQVEQLSGQINDIARAALLNLPRSTRTRGILGSFLGSVLGPSSNALYSNVLSSVNLFGREGLFPGVGRTLNQLTGPPTDLTALKLKIPTGSGTSTEIQVQTQEQYRAAQIQAQIRAIEIALASTVGAAAGGGGTGAQVGGQLGAIGGLALGAKLGKFGGPTGAVIGALIGGLLGGIFDNKKKPKPELEALQIIARNSGEQVTLLENANRLLELQTIAFNIPTGFSLPAYNPSLSSAMFGGQQPIVSNAISVEVSVGVAGASAGEIGQVVAQAVSDRLNDEYRNSGRYVSRTRY